MRFHGFSESNEAAMADIEDANPYKSLAVLGVATPKIGIDVHRIHRQPVTETSFVCRLSHGSLSVPSHALHSE
jgi:hypothetical protein